VFLVIFACAVFFFPNYMGHPDNYIPANPLQTPEHIVPEWYFLPFYTMLRAITFDIGIPFTDVVIIEAKLGGVIAMFASILILFVLPWLDRSPVRSARFRPIYKQFFWLLIIDCVVLGWVGANPPEGHFVLIGQIATAYYFAFFLVIMPLLGRYETPRPLPTSISEPVLGGGGRAAAPAAAKPMEKA
jgi:quinol-cytochrome oxidoreductase complex cytochrome b subunit